MNVALPLIVLFTIKFIHCQTTINYRVNILYESEGDIKISFLIEDCSENLAVESNLGRTYINSAIWIVERINLLQTTSPLTLGLSVYQTCNDTDVYNTLFHIFQQHEYIFHLGIVVIKPFSRSLIEFCRALDIKTKYVYKHLKPPVKASVELLALLNWKENVTILTQYQEITHDFYKYARKEWICVKNIINSEIRPIIVSPLSPTIVFAEKEVVEVILNQLNSQKSNWKIIIVPVDGETVHGLPEGSYIIQPTYGDIIQTFVKSPKIIPTPLFFDIAYPIINYAKEVTQTMNQYCNATSFKLNCLRTRYQDISDRQNGDNQMKANIMIARALCVSLPYAAAFSLMLSRAILLATISKERNRSETTKKDDTLQSPLF
ncbi:boss [Trypoxylus dichotomus]